MIGKKGTWTQISTFVVKNTFIEAASSQNAIRRLLLLLMIVLIRPSRYTMHSNRPPSFSHQYLCRRRWKDRIFI